MYFLKYGPGPRLGPAIPPMWIDWSNYQVREQVSADESEESNSSDESEVDDEYVHANVRVPSLLTATKRIHPLRARAPRSFRIRLVPRSPWILGIMDNGLVRLLNCTKMMRTSAGFSLLMVIVWIWTSKKYSTQLNCMLAISKIRSCIISYRMYVVFVFVIITHLIYWYSY